MKIHSIETGFFKLDGGAMFGVVPRSMWQRLNPPDENNLCTWAMRCLLIQKEGRNILVDTGIGDKQDAKFRSHFHPHGDASLLGSLEELGLIASDITDVLFTHLHFDHSGGAVTKDEAGNLVPTFPNATYWTNEAHWNWAMNPNIREKASYLQDNFVPIQEAGLLKFIDFDGKNEVEWEGIQLRLLYGHTDSMMMPIIPYGDTKLVYCADLIPSMHHLGLPYVMSYDIRPLETLKEKKILLDEALEQDWKLFFEHDPVNEICSLIKNDRGRIKYSNPAAL
ncbi:MAG: glyoxylase-like metal-dependent hydrolase (beta-lactamase superfamily II) [Maribacter sp.]|jgi:glyoxylase-like metal-dependent hydrolase (beta-lactamase superfamily II)